MAADSESPVSLDEAAALFPDLEHVPAALLAVSGGPDSTALLLLAARWRSRLARGPKLVAATVDHGLRPEAVAEARAVARLARRLGIAHRILRWTGQKPATGLQEAARAARYRLLAQVARKAGSPVVVTAHTLDDQAETVLLRLARGSGLTGLAGMQRVTPLPTAERAPSSLAGRDGAVSLTVLRPFLSVPKSRLIATLRAENIVFADDPSNRDPRFTRARLRRLMPLLAEEGLDVRRLAKLAERLARAEAALNAAAAQAFAGLANAERGALVLPTPAIMGLAEEIRLRLLGRAVAETGDEGPVELGRLEALQSALAAACGQGGNARFRRSLAGAIVTLTPKTIRVERAPPRRSRASIARKAGVRVRPKRR